MKYLIILFLAFACNYLLPAQDFSYYGYTIDFENEYQLGRITIDSSIKSNSWQVGPPMKSWLSDTKSNPNVIITDTLNPYPVNDSSVFYIMHVPIPKENGTHYLDFTGYYKCDSDTLVDYCKIELSPDNGKSWIDLLTAEQIFWSDKPILTGKSDWSSFYINFGEFSENYILEDTLFIRFNFISDDIDTHRGGVMFDDLRFNEGYMGINSKNIINFKTEIYPNPADTQLDIYFKNRNSISFNLKIFDSSGRLIDETNNHNGELINIDLSGYSSGTYFYKLFSDQNSLNSLGQFIVN